MVLSKNVAEFLGILAALIVGGILLFAVIIPNNEIGKSFAERIAEFISNPIKFLSATGGGGK